MAKIEMSPAFATGYVTRMTGMTLPSVSGLGWPAQSPMLANGGTGTASQVTYLAIMRGVMPTDFTTLINSDSRITDRLVMFDTAVDFIPSKTTVNPIVIGTNYVPAVQSGLATWFWLYTRYNGYTSPLNGITPPPGVTNKTITQQLIGTVGTVGSNADLEIPDTELIADLAYRITNLSLKFPTSWVY